MSEPYPVVPPQDYWEQFGELGFKFAFQPFRYEQWLYTYIPSFGQHLKTIKDVHRIHICVSVPTCVLPGKPSQFHHSVGKESNTNRKIKFVENENGIVANACIAQVPWAGRLCCRTVSGLGGESCPTLATGNSCVFYSKGVLVYCLCKKPVKIKETKFI